jgi:hypothetical protein
MEVWPVLLGWVAYRYNRLYLPGVNTIEAVKLPKPLRVIRTGSK